MIHRNDNQPRSSLYLVLRAEALLGSLKFFISETDSVRRRVQFLAQSDFWEWEIDNLIYSFTNLASVSALVQYNGQTGLYSSNVRLALLNRSGTGLFVVYNDRRDVLSSTSYETVGRSFVVKYTRLFDF